MSDFDADNLIASLPGQPGIYQMYDSADKILYVGKAKNLKNRVASYFRQTGLNSKTMALVAKIAQVLVTITKTEAEALILEHNLIKSQQPPYNILLRDDKSYPYLFLSAGDFPRISLHRGAQKKKGHYFGPFPNVGAVKDSLYFLQKTFRLRNCEDSVFSNRTRPCLQYQINRCTGPCVKLIGVEDYAKDIEHAELFLRGSSDQLIQELADSMEFAAEKLDYEQAAQLRDQIAALRRIQSQQGIDAGGGDIDIIGCASEGGLACVHLLFIRRGRMLGSKSYFPKLTLNQSNNELLESFITQFYLADQRKDLPREVVIGMPLESADIIAEALTLKAKRNININHSVRSKRSKWLSMAQETAEQNLKARIGSRQNTRQRFVALKERLQLVDIPTRLECFDISHSSGEKTVASCVVFNVEGPLKSDYRRFNIDGITGGDDYAAMEQALTRRYTRVQKEEGKLPDILFVDGGKGQLNRARAVMLELGINSVMLIGIAKGSTRKAGFETLYLETTDCELSLDSHDPALHLIQYIRDESHRFAIGGHKQRRDKQRKTSRLEEIEGIGPKRRRELLRHFGGLQEIERASADEIATVKGISKIIAEEIYAAFRG
jgi:excinuclease ABC subunit C